MEDSEIVGLFWNRSESAIAETHQKYGKLCSRLAENILHSKEDTEECVQDTYLAAWNRIPEERPRYFSAFLCRITRNIALNRLDYLLAKKRNSDCAVALEELEQVLFREEQLEGQIEFNELVEAVNEFLSKLPPQKRGILVRRYFFFDTIPEIAKYNQMKVNTVKSILARENKKLRTFLTERGYGNGK